MATPEIQVENEAKIRSMEARIFCDEKTRTHQNFRDECDINSIVKRYGITGQVPQGLKLPVYGDFTGVLDYQSALNAVMQAESVFNAVPADIRARFNNDPQKFVEFCSDNKNLDELRKLGLAPPAPLEDKAAAPPDVKPDAENPSK